VRQAPAALCCGCCGARGGMAALNRASLPKYGLDKELAQNEAAKRDPKDGECGLMAGRREERARSTGARARGEKDARAQSERSGN
jgi:hypothetical protein